VLGVFESANQAVFMAGEMLRSHQSHLQRWPESVRMEIRLGVASGEVLQVDGDTYGDAVNVASRLSEKAGPSEVWVNDVTAVDAGVVPGIRFRKLGEFDIRGKTESQMVFLAEWRDVDATDMLTMQAGLSAAAPLNDSQLGSIRISWNGATLEFSSDEVPVQIGRANGMQLCVPDPRVSRVHARIDWHQGSFTLTDQSSFGTWVLFEAGETAVQLRRDSCLLHGAGKIALGMPFGAGAPVLSFLVSGSNMRLQR
jgi:pSer/pThr/pTyr-binding forkhead associated (FHA) protein